MCTHIDTPPHTHTQEILANVAECLRAFGMICSEPVSRSPRLWSLPSATVALCLCEPLS